MQSLLEDGNAPIWRKREPRHMRLSGTDGLSANVFQSVKVGLCALCGAAVHGHGQVQNPLRKLRQPLRRRQGGCRARHQNRTLQFPRNLNYFSIPFQFYLFHIYSRIETAKKVDKIYFYAVSVQSSHPIT